MLRVLSIIQQLLQENKHGTKRDIYYMQPSIFLGMLFLICYSYNFLFIFVKLVKAHIITNEILSSSNNNVTPIQGFKCGYSVGMSVQLIFRTC